MVTPRKIVVTGPDNKSCRIWRAQIGGRTITLSGWASYDDAVTEAKAIAAKRNVKEIRLF